MVVLNNCKSHRAGSEQFLTASVHAAALFMTLVEIPRLRQIVDFTSRGFPMDDGSSVISAPDRPCRAWKLTAPSQTQQAELSKF